VPPPAETVRNNNMKLTIIAKIRETRTRFLQPTRSECIWLLQVGSLVKTPRAIGDILPEVTGVWGFKRPITAVTFHHGITALIGH